ncbi:DUF309 domain-containing protein [Gymnodinialimonas ceratoperidinii]|uniref:DUF309 domain-containing protein n=1 Tax=Gymnodinialimonas ceratoperidinii TaxID=2856823 RepID=A0A8F6TV15_9RHOB|nr:DUF309 domain-containing protein [Gymnodinialimonas ceratoperidinii]QXT38221.1 DUF309 domain-containing protein [Gymnodinialimonas ceratoperidinii]
MTRAVFTPTHAYVPGKTPRHPEGCFDAIRDTAQPGMDARALAETDAFQTGLAYLEQGYFWEAHEVLEPVWMILPEECDARLFVQALIQLANARLKHRMERPKAALRLCAIVRGLLEETSGGVIMGIETADIVAQIDSLEGELSDDL